MSARYIPSAALLALIAACSSTGDVGDPSPVLDTNGQTAPQRNLLMSDLSYGSPGRGHAINETFDLQVTSFRVAEDPNGSTFPNGQGVLGLVQNSATSEGYGQGNTLEFDAGTGVFTFNIDTDAGSFSRSLFDILLDDPRDVDLENGAIAKVWGSNPSNIQAYFPIPGIDGNSSYFQIADALTTLSESQNEADVEYYEALAEYANDLISAGDGFVYGYNLTDGYGYYTATNMESADEGTDTVAIGEFREFYDDGDEAYGFFVFGHRTPLGEMPTTGTTTFTGKLSGEVLTNNATRSLTGGVEMDVNFVTGLLDFTLSSVIRQGGNNEGTTTFLDYKTLTGQGIISDTEFSGDLLEVNGNASGNFRGAFFGPIANEAGGTFRFGDGASYAAGAFTAAQPDQNRPN